MQNGRHEFDNCRGVQGTLSRLHCFRRSHTKGNDIEKDMARDSRRSAVPANHQPCLCSLGDFLPRSTQRRQGFKAHPKANFFKSRRLTVRAKDLSGPNYELKLRAYHPKAHSHAKTSSHTSFTLAYISTRAQRHTQVRMCTCLYKWPLCLRRRPSPSATNMMCQRFGHSPLCTKTSQATLHPRPKQLCLLMHSACPRPLCTCKLAILHF